MRPIRALIPVLLLLIAGATSAQPARVADASAAWDSAREEQLWLRGQWLNLLHADGAPGSWRSHADDPRFFLARSGGSDPAAELEATLQALYAPAALGDEHAQCRFVARAHWLQQTLGLEGLPQPDCAAWRTFSELVQASRAVLVFPSYYLNSPSSMFGHTLLRLDPEDSSGGAEYLSFAVNFGAEVDPSDNGMFYAFKGLTGGYPGQYKVDHYYKKIQEYNRDENRDIWEYPLNLSAAETMQLIRHLWELQGINFAYYFFDENCSFRVLELLEVARPGIDLTSGFGISAIPIDTVRAAQRADLVRGKQFRPAKGTVLRQRLAALPPVLHPEVKALGADPARLQSPALQALAPATRALLVETAYKHLRYTQIGAARDPVAARNSFALLRALKAHADVLPEAGPAARPENSPDLSHGSRRLSAGLWREERLDYLSLGLRLSLHSLEENATGFLPGAQINIGNFELRVDETARVDLERIDLVDIISLSPRDRFFAPLSWSILTGLERQWADGSEHRVAHVTGGVGGSWALAPGGLGYALVTGRLEHNQGFADPLQPAAGVRSGLLQHFGEHILQMELAAQKFANGQQRLRATWRHNLRLDRHQALHLEMNWRDQAPRSALAFGLRYQYYY